MPATPHFRVGDDRGNLIMRLLNALVPPPSLDVVTANAPSHLQRRQLSTIDWLFSAGEQPTAPAFVAEGRTRRWPKAAAQPTTATTVRIGEPGHWPLNKPFTPFVTAINTPAFMDRQLYADTAMPMLAEAGIRVWRYPGGQVGDTWCPTTSADPHHDACFERYPILKRMGHFPTPPNFLHLAQFIDECRKHACIPILQMNAVVALQYGPAACASLTAAIIHDFAKAGIIVRYVEFGNELYGTWSTALQRMPSPSDGQPPYTPESYASNFTAVRTALLNKLPPNEPSFGLLLNEVFPHDRKGNNIIEWNERVLSSRSGARSDADWVTVHRYYSGIWAPLHTDAEVLWLGDSKDRGSGPGYLHQLAQVVEQHYSLASGSGAVTSIPTPPIAVTEYNSVFRPHSGACGASRQYINLLFKQRL